MNRAQGGRTLPNGRPADRPVSSTTLSSISVATRLATVSEPDALSVGSECIWLNSSEESSMTLSDGSTGSGMARDGRVSPLSAAIGPSPSETSRVPPVTAGTTSPSTRNLSKDFAILRSAASYALAAFLVSLAMPPSTDWRSMTSSSNWSQRALNRTCAAPAHSDRAGATSPASLDRIAVTSAAPALIFAATSRSRSGVTAIALGTCFPVLRGTELTRTTGPGLRVPLGAKLVEGLRDALFRRFVR